MFTKQIPLHVQSPEWLLQLQNGSIISFSIGFGLGGISFEPTVSKAHEYLKLKLEIKNIYNLIGLHFKQSKAVPLRASP